MVQKQNIVPAIQPEQNDITKPMLLKTKRNKHFSAGFDTRKLSIPNKPIPLCGGPA